MKDHIYTVVNRYKGKIYAWDVVNEAIDNEEPQILNINKDKKESIWNKNVANNINIQYSYHQNIKAGPHIIFVWMVDAGLVTEKFVVSPSDYLEESFLVPKESVYFK